MVPSIVVLLLQIGFGATFYWTYSKQERWPFNCYGTTSQSPISIDHRKTIDIFSNALKFSDSYFEPIQATLKNTGHTIEVEIINNHRPLTISGGGLEDDYILSSFHFHWGAEHVINGCRYPLEGHFVHYNSKYGNLDTALSYKDGIVVLGVFYEISESNRAFHYLQSVIKKVAHSVNCPLYIGRLIRVIDYLPVETRTFYGYRGSLTTPEYNEVVTWILFNNPSYISSKQVHLFTETMDENNKRISKNYRELQCLNGRNVYFVRCG